MRSKLRCIAVPRCILIVDDQIDQFFVGNAQRSYYESLLLAGVRIHAYTEAFLHTKAVSIDGQMAWIGSCNLDMRSFELNEEVVALFFDHDIAAQLVAIEEGYMRGSHQITLDQWRKRPFVQELTQNLTRLVSPLCSGSGTALRPVRSSAFDCIHENDSRRT